MGTWNRNAGGGAKKLAPSAPSGSQLRAGSVIASREAERDALFIGQRYMR